MKVIGNKEKNVMCKGFKVKVLIVKECDENKKEKKEFWFQVNIHGKPITCECKQRKIAKCVKKNKRFL